MRTYLMIASLAIAAPAAAECTPDLPKAAEHFNEAFKALFEYQSVAHVCAPSIGEAHAQSGVMEIQAFLMRGGIAKNDAIIQADDADKSAAERAKKSSFADRMAQINAKAFEISAACLEDMNEHHRRYEVEQAKMLKAGCIPD